MCMWGIIMKWFDESGLSIFGAIFVFLANFGVFDGFWSAAIVDYWR